MKSKKINLPPEYAVYNFKSGKFLTGRANEGSRPYSYDDVNRAQWDLEDKLLHFDRYTELYTPLYIKYFQQHRKFIKVVKITKTLSPV